MTLFMYDTPGVTLTVTKPQAATLLMYCNECYANAFRRMHNYSRFEPDREALFKWIIVSLTNRLVYKSITENTTAAQKKVVIKLDYGQRVALRAMFRRLPVPTILEELENKILNQLKP